MSSVLRRSPFILRSGAGVLSPFFRSLSITSKKFFLRWSPCHTMLWTPAPRLAKFASFWGLSKNRDIVDETYVIKLIAVVGVLTAVIQVLANLQTMTDTLILPNCREHPQQSVDTNIEQLRRRDAALRYICIKHDWCTFCIVWSQTDCCALVNLLQ